MEGEGGQGLGEAEAQVKRAMAARDTAGSRDIPIYLEQKDTLIDRPRLTPSSRNLPGSGFQTSDMHAPGKYSHAWIAECTTSTQWRHVGNQTPGGSVLPVVRCRGSAALTPPRRVNAVARTMAGAVQRESATGAAAGLPHGERSVRVARTRMPSPSRSPSTSASASIGNSSRRSSSRSSGRRSRSSHSSRRSSKVRSVPRR